MNAVHPICLLFLLALATSAWTAEPRVYRDRVQPHWLPGNNQFWYKVATGPDSSETILVDAEKGTRQPGFDPAKVRTTNSVPTLPARNSARASTRTGTETSLTFVNRTQGEVELFWLNSEGERQSYGKLAAGAERDQHTFAGHVWLVADREGKTLAVFEAEDAGGVAEITGKTTEGPTPRPESRRRSRGSDISPDGRWKAFVKDNNVRVRATDFEKELTLSTDGTPDDAYGDRFYWSPDSKKLVVYRTKKGEDHKIYFIESSPKDQVQPKLHSVDYRKAGDRLPIPKPQLFDVAEGKQIPVNDELFANPWSIEDLRWAPDSSRFTFLFNQRGHQVLRIVAVDANTGAARSIVDERSPTFICYSGKFFCEYLDDTSEIIWMSERDGWNHLYLYDAKTGQVKSQITKGEWVVRKVEEVDRAKRQIWFQAGGIRSGQDPYHLHFCRVNFDGTGLTILTEGDGTHALQYSPDKRFFIDTYSRVDLPTVNELRRTADGQLVCELERADWGDLLKSGWQTPERFVAKARDGSTDIYGVIFRPSDLNPNTKYPVIESIYAGPQGSFVPKSFSASPRHKKMVERGFIVVQIDGMGTSNRSKKFHDVCWKNLGDSGFPDRILWMKAASAKYPYMDLSRVGIYGGSAGGQSALRAVLAYGDFYKAAAADCGCHDNRMDKIWWNEQWMGWPIGPEYEEQSNVTQAHKLQGKLLLTFGELDRNVDPASTMQVVNALIKANKDFELIVFPGADHGAGGSPYGERRRLDFFARSLGLP